MATATFDPLMNRVFVGSLMAHGFMDDMIEVDYDEDTFSKFTGADGETTRVRNRNEGGKITLTIAQSSSFNDDLSLLFNSDKETALAKFPVMIKDFRGTLLVSASEAWITKSAPISIGKEIKAREWVIDCAKLKVITVGSASA